MSLSLAENTLFDWAHVDLIAGSLEQSTARIASRRNLIRLRAPIIQLQMKFDNVVKFVPRERLHLLDHSLETLFGPNCPNFFYVQEALEETGVFMVGHLVQMSEDELAQFTSRKKLIEQMRLELKEWGLDLGLKAPHWKQGKSLWYNFDQDEYRRRGKRYIEELQRGE